MHKVFLGQSFIMYSHLKYNSSRDNPFHTYPKFSEKLTLLTPWYTQVSRGKKYSFLENFAYVLNERSITIKYLYLNSMIYSSIRTEVFYKFWTILREKHRYHSLFYKTPVNVCKGLQWSVNISKVIPFLKWLLPRKLWKL